MMRPILFIAVVLLLIAVPVSADYAIPIQALSSSPADGASNYMGILPTTPTTTVNLSVQLKEERFGFMMIRIQINKQ